jgi:hypothetical protein
MEPLKPHTHPHTAAFVDKGRGSFLPLGKESILTFNPMHKGSSRERTEKTLTDQGGFERGDSGRRHNFFS